MRCDPPSLPLAWWPLFSEIADYQLTFELRERHHHTLFTDQTAVHILELAKFNKAVEELATSLDRWLFFLRHAEELDADALPQPLNVPEVRWAMGDLVMISQSDRDRELYESRLKMRRDISTALAEAKEAGQAEGWEKGQAEGWENGQAEGWEKGRTEVQIRRVQSLQRLLRQQISSPEQLKSLPFSNLESLAAQLEDEVNARLSNG